MSIERTCHNDHFDIKHLYFMCMSAGYQCKLKESDPRGLIVGVKWGQTHCSVTSSSDFSSETAGQISMKRGHNDHLAVGIIIYTLKGSPLMLNLRSTSPLKPLIIF